MKNARDRVPYEYALPVIGNDDATQGLIGPSVIGNDVATYRLIGRGTRAVLTLLDGFQSTTITPLLTTTSNASYAIHPLLESGTTAVPSTGEDPGADSFPDEDFLDKERSDTETGPRRIST